METGGEKWQESNTSQLRKFSESWQWTVVVTWSQKLMIFFLPDGGDFIAERSNEVMLDETVYCFVWKRSGKCLFTNLSPFLTWRLCCYQDNSTVNYAETNLRVYTINVQSFITINSRTNTQCFSECDYPVCVQTSPGSHRPVQSGTGVQKGLNVTPVCVIWKDFEEVLERVAQILVPVFVDGFILVNSFTTYLLRCEFSPLTWPARS